MQTLARHFLNFVLYCKTSGKPMKSFVHRCDMIRFALQKQLSIEAARGVRLAFLFRQ